MSKLVSTIQRNFNKGFKYFDLFKNSILEHKALNTSHLKDYGFKFNNNLNLNLLNNELQNTSLLNNSYLEGLYNRTVDLVDDDIFERSVKSNDSVFSDPIDEFVEETNNSHKHMIKSKSLNTLSNRGLTKVVKRGFSEIKKGINAGGDFESLVTKSSIFVDKSLFIKEVIEDYSEVILITMPRRCGKSRNLDMLKRFLSISEENDQQKNLNKQIFSSDKVVKLNNGKTTSLNITKETLKIKNPDDIFGLPKEVNSKDLQGQFPVIAVDFKNCKSNSFEAVKSGLKIQIQEAFSDHKYLSVSNKLDPESKQLFDKYSGVISSKTLTDVEIQNGLKFLSSLLHTYHNKKVWILIDEYDSVTNNAFINFGKREYLKDKKEFKNDGDFKKLNVLLSTMMGSALKENPHLEKGVVTGILRVSKNDMLSPLNNLKEYNLTDNKYSKYYGFNEEEIGRLVEHFDLDELGKKQLTKMANGYAYGDQKGIYNTWSAINFLNDKANKANSISDEWESSGGLDLVKSLITSNVCQSDLHKLQLGESLTIDLKRDISYEKLLNGKISTMFNILLWTGYLTPCNVITEEGKISVKVPNNPIRSVFKEQIQEWAESLGMKISSLAEDYFKPMLEELGNQKAFQENIQEFNKRLKEQLNEAKDSSKISKLNEHLIHDLMSAIVCMLPNTSHHSSDSKSGKGRADIMFQIKESKIGFIIELKYNGCHKDALKQIQDKEYIKAFSTNDYNTLVTIGTNVQDKNNQININSEYKILESNGENPLSEWNFNEVDSIEVLGDI